MFVHPGSMRTYIGTWLREYWQLYLKGPKCAKLTKNEYDFDLLVDMLFSFWVLKPIPKSHPKLKALQEKGIFYTCTCPEFLHYHSCKHVIALALHKGHMCVPVKYSTKAAGKRKAPAGASLRKRGNCLEVDK